MRIAPARSASLTRWLVASAPSTPDRQHALSLTHAPFLPLQVSKARDHVESGVGELIKAKKLQKSTRKWMCCALVVLLIIIAVIVVVAIRPWR